MACCPPAHRAGHHLENAGGIDGLAFVHASFEGFDFEFAGIEESVQIELAVFERSIGGLCPNGAGSLNFGALGVARVVWLASVAVFASSWRVFSFHHLGCGLGKYENAVKTSQLSPVPNNSVLSSSLFAV